MPDDPTERGVSVSFSEDPFQLIFRASGADTTATYVLRMTQADIAKALGLSKAYLACLDIKFIAEQLAPRLRLTREQDAAETDSTQAPKQPTTDDTSAPPAASSSGVETVHLVISDLDAENSCISGSILVSSNTKLPVTSKKVSKRRDGKSTPKSQYVMLQVAYIVNYRGVALLRFTAVSAEMGTSSTLDLDLTRHLDGKFSSSQATLCTLANALLERLSITTPDPTFDLKIESLDFLVVE